MGICCMAQETQIVALYPPRGVRWWGRWEGVSKHRGCVFTYSWFMLRFDGKQQNSVKQLSFNKKKKLIEKGGFIYICICIYILYTHTYILLIHFVIKQ